MRVKAEAIGALHCAKEMEEKTVKELEKKTGKEREAVRYNNEIASNVLTFNQLR